MAMSIPGFSRVFERVYNLPEGAISRDPEAAAILATTPVVCPDGHRFVGVICPDCGKTGHPSL
jgi:hypothetical protein